MAQHVAHARPRSCSRQRGGTNRSAAPPVAHRSVSMPDDVARQAAQAARAADACAVDAAPSDKRQPLAAPCAGSGGGGASCSSSDVRSRRICSLPPCLGLPGTCEASATLLALALRRLAT